jgi:lysophospholipid acyltransferase (LPLAT)-like uncharacterized protein
LADAEAHGERRDARTADRPERGKRPATKMRTAWRRLREPLVQSRFAKAAVAATLSQVLRFIRLTNPLAAGSMRLPSLDVEPAIIAIWHGQHFLIPAFYPSKRKLVAMVSKSADAEMNALVLERFGIETVRGSGGRDNSRHLDKGGAKALITLKRALETGWNAAMIADIPHGAPREAGLGIVLLARLSGRPIVPVAVATSRRRVLEKSWDKSTINLPFGRSALGFGPLVSVPADADDATMQAKRRELTDALNAATAEAYRIVDGAKVAA